MSLVERDKKVIWHPFTQQKNMLSPVPITKGKDTLLFDENGNTYIDAISSWWVNLHGHAILLLFVSTVLALSIHLLK